MPKSHRIDIAYSGDLRKEGSTNCSSQKATTAPKGFHCSTDLEAFSLSIPY